MSESHPTAVAEATTTRRTVLRSAGLVALAGAGASALVACSSDAETASPSTGTSASASAAESPSASASESASSSSSASASESASSAPSVAGTSIAKSEVTEGGGVLVADKYVVTQPSAGEFKAFTAICTHQGCVVQGVQDKEIVCACHNSHFSISDGSVISGPAQSALASVDLTESGSDLVIPD